MKLFLLTMTPLVVAIAVVVAARCAAADKADQIDLQPLLSAIHKVGPKGAGHQEAMEAYRQLARASADRLPEILAGLDDANPLAANWIRAAVDTIAERCLNDGGSLPKIELERFLADRRHAPRARRLAYELLARVDETAHDRLIPGMLDDPSLELRRDAVAHAMQQADALANKPVKKTDAIAAYRTALNAARDRDQIDALAEKLKALGTPVDLPAQFGLLVDWWLIGPFDNTGERGFDRVYEPEKEFKPAAYPGKAGQVKWFRHTTTDRYGTVDLNKVIGEQKGVIAYAAAEFIAPADRAVELRMATFNAPKIWLNGQLLLSKKIYHSGQQFDQYIGRGTMKKGKNLVLVKICQNEQTQSWAKHWRFKLRVCDAFGGAVLSTDRRKPMGNDK